MTDLPSAEAWYLIGLPGSGKSKVGFNLAAALRVPHIDIDTEIEKKTGKTIAAIFRDEGKDRFRELEAQVILETADSPGVVSLGGGAIETSAVADFLEDRTVVWIDADFDVLLARVTRNNRRPLLQEDPETQLAELKARRDPIYAHLANCHVTSSNAPADDVVKQIISTLLGWEYTPVKGSHRYNVLTGAGTSALLKGYLPRDATRALLVYPESLRDASRSIAKVIGEAGLTVTDFSHVDGEHAKNIETVVQAWDLLGEVGLGRRDVVVTFGGGVTTDLGGFIAASWLRGVRVIHLPTTLLAMVDAALGGKTGIDTPAGKNLVGAFHDPHAVLVDLLTLESLPQGEYVAGLAEVIKTGFIDDPQILRIISEHPEIGSVRWATGKGRLVLTEIVSRSIAVKARVVSSDRLEGGLREILNYGHTMGHAIERAEHYTMRHGEAVAIGSVFAANLAHSLGLVPESVVVEHEEAFRSVGLPIHYRGQIEVLMEGLRSDKKVRQGNLRFVLLGEDGRPTVREVSPSTVEKLAVDMGMGEK